MIREAVTKFIADTYKTNVVRNVSINVVDQIDVILPPTVKREAPPNMPAILHGSWYLDNHSLVSMHFISMLVYDDCVISSDMYGNKITVSFYDPEFFEILHRFLTTGYTNQKVNNETPRI